jgi:tetratricopeptide (TPR) repeat protein
MHRTPFVAWVLALALSSNAAWAVDAQPANSTDLARQRFQEAAQAYQEGRYSAAASLFEAADRLAPHPSTRYNAATAWEQAGESARAATGYEASLALDRLDPGRRKIAEERLASLKESLARVRIAQPLGALVTVDHVQRAPVPTSFYLRPGDYEIGIEYRGATSTKPTEVVAGQDYDLKLNLPFMTTPAPPAPNPLPPTTVVPAAPPPDLDETQKTWAWVSVGTGIALGGAAIVLGLRALSARERYVESGNTSRADRNRASDLRLATNVLWGGATVAGATGLVLLLTAPTVEF